MMGEGMRESDDETHLGNGAFPVGALEGRKRKRGPQNFALPPGLGLPGCAP
jgi:hypothetical protein